jgi:hypothetical protein
MELVEIERRLLVLLNQLHDELPAAELEEMKDLVRAGEPGVALENCCSQLFEYERKVPKSIVDALDELARAMGVDEKYCRNLR